MILRYAVLVDGVVVNVVMWDGTTTWDPGAGATAVLCTDPVTVGWTYSDGNFTAPADPAPGV